MKSVGCFKDISFSSLPLASVTVTYMLLLNALLSYWNPWIYLFLNADIQQELRQLICPVAPITVPVIFDKKS